MGSSQVFANETDEQEVYGNEVKFYPNEMFEAADMDDIIVYSENQMPITKRDIVSGNFELKMKIAPRTAVEKLTIKMPSGKTSAIAVETISVPRFYQKSEHLWLPSLEGAKYASSIEASETEQVLALAAGFIPKVGWIVALPWGLSILRRGHVASEIREITNEGDDVEVVRISTNYGTFFNIKYWNAKEIVVLKPLVEETPHMKTVITSSYSFK